MKLYRTTDGAVIEHDRRFYRLEAEWDQLLTRDDLYQFLSGNVSGLKPLPASFSLADDQLQPPIKTQEVWAAGVTYYRSRVARMEEAKTEAGADVYERVYDAERPELFFKATPQRVAGHGQTVRIRSDSRWNVPEPELALLVTPQGKITGYTIGNDMSSRDIEGENPLYLPQAKIYDQSCALGPGILLTAAAPLPQTTEIRMEIVRRGETVFGGAVQLSAMKRSHESLVEYLFRDNSFPAGCFLLTGTGIVPPDSFTLEAGDEISITIEAIGTLVNRVG